MQTHPSNTQNITHNIARPNIINRAIIFIISGYQYLISPLLPSSCRFQPTCSQYVIESFSQHSFIKAVQFSISRLVKCHPWGSFGYDPVPVSSMQVSQDQIDKLHICSKDKESKQ